MRVCKLLGQSIDQFTKLINEKHILFLDDDCRLVINRN